MWKRAEDQVGLVERCIFSRNEGDVMSTYARSLPPLSVSSCEAELKTGVPRDEHAELASGVAAGAENTDRKFMHK